MRRMYSENQLVNVINEAINKGEVDNAKPIYWHTVSFTRGGTAEQSSIGRVFGTMIILSNTNTAITNTSFMNYLKINGFYGVVINGQHSGTGAANFENMENNLIALKYSSDAAVLCVVRNKTTNTLITSSISISNFVVNDEGVNKIN